MFIAQNIVQNISSKSIPDVFESFYTQTSRLKNI